MPNGLLNNLIAYWPGDEASGNLLDAHTNNLDQDDYNTVTNADGLVYATARQYTRANHECHYRVDTALQPGDNDWTVAAWCYLDSLPSAGEIYGLISKHRFSDNKEFYINLNDTPRLVFSVGNGDTTDRGTVTANTFGAPSTGTWYLVVVWHDSVNDKIYIQVNNGTADDADTTGAMGVSTIGWEVGLFAWDGWGHFWNGRIGPTAFWRSTGGDGGVLTADQRTALWNSGDGLDYASFDSGASISESASASASISPSASLSPSASVSPSVSESVSASASESASPSPSPAEMEVCWGHVTGVLEDDIRPFNGNWTGTGEIVNPGGGDAEKVCLEAGESMTSELVYTGAVHVEVLQNVYGAGDDVDLDYRTGNTPAVCLAAAWNNYVGPFLSDNFIQVKLTSTL